MGEEDEPSVAGEATVEDSLHAKADAGVEQEPAIGEEAAVEEEAAIEEEATVEEEPPVEQATTVTEEPAVAGKAATEKELAAEDDATVEEEAAVDEETPAEVEPTVMEAATTPRQNLTFMRLEVRTSERRCAGVTCASAISGLRWVDCGRKEHSKIVFRIELCVKPKTKSTRQNRTPCV